MKWSIKIILFFALIAVAGPLLSNDKPLLLISDGRLTFPFLSEESVSVIENDFYIMPIIPYKAGASDFNNADYKSPFDIQNGLLFKRHWLGTTLRGCDVLAGIISGARFTLIVGFFSALLSLIIGFLLGAGAAFSSDKMFRLSWLQLLFIIPLFIFNINVLLNVEANSVLKILFFISTIALLFLLGKINQHKSIRVNLNFDHLGSQLTILFSAIPRLFFVVAIMGVFHQGIFTLIFLLGITGWMEIARLVRSEIQKIHSSDYYSAAKLSGATWMRITLKQLLPNLKSLLIAVFAFSFAGAIMSEASLSFLGFGLTADQVTWGSLILEGKESFHAWWLILFPGLCLSSCLYALFSIARSTNNDNYSL